MLEASITEVQQVQNSKPLAPFGVRAPLTSPLVDPGRLLIRKGNSTVDVIWSGESFPKPDGFAEKILKSVVDCARKDTQRFPTNPRVHSNLALALLRAGQLDVAVEELQEALRIDPLDYIAGLTLGRIQIGKGNVIAAESLFTRLLNYRPDDPNLLLGLARAKVEGGDFSVAETLIKRADPNNHLSSAQFLLGIVRLRSGNIPGAINVLKSASRTDVRNPALHHALGVAYAMAEEFPRAEQAFRVALSLASDSASSLRALCTTLLDQERNEEALSLLKPHVESHPGDIEARELLWRADFKLKRYTSARSQIRQLIQDLGDSVSPWRRSRLIGDIAATFGAERNWKEAEAGCRKAIEIDASASSTPYENLARMHFLQNRVQDGLTVLENAKALFSGSESIRILLSTGYARLERFRDALSEVTPLLDSGTTSRNAYAHLGWLYSWMGQFEMALAVAKAGSERYPRVPGLINNLAYAYLELGHPAEARATLGSIRKGSDTHPEFIATHGLLRLWERDFNGGKELYEKAARKASENGNRELARKIRQKLHLELAKAFVRQGDFNSAQKEIGLGLAIRISAFSYEPDLTRLAQQLAQA